jgi:hypothetical protein
LKEKTKEEEINKRQIKNRHQGRERISSRYSQQFKLEMFE